MSRVTATPELDLLIEGLVRQQKRLITRDPWLPKSSGAVELQLREAADTGALHIIRGDCGVLGLLDSDNHVRRLLGPVPVGTEWEAAAEVLLDALPAEREQQGDVVRAAVNAEDQRRRRILEKKQFRRYNAEMTLTLAREEWVPGRRPPESPGRITKAQQLQKPEEPLRRRRMIRIRPYALGDEAALYRFHPDSAYLSVETVIARSQNGGGTTLIAEEELAGRRRPLGYLYQEVEAGTGEICFVNVEEHARGRGIGTRLITAALDTLFFETGVELVEISVRPENPAADLYRRIGFSPIVTYYSYERRL